MKTELFNFRNRHGQLIFALKDLRTGLVLIESIDVLDVLQYDKQARLAFNVAKQTKTDH